MAGRGEAGQAMLEYVVGVLLVALVAGAALRKLALQAADAERRVERHYSDGRN